jgi:S-adenosylmethionine hydrolase
MKRPFISLSSDFGVGTQGIGIMRAVALQICPDCEIIDLRHGIPSFDLTEGAWTMESAVQLPVGAHVCVVDPGVGTSRRGIIIKTKRGDYLVGPDNGVLLPAARRLGGIVRAVEITNRKYMRNPVSPVFHGRDVFAPAAAWLSKGVRIEEFGPVIEPERLAKAPYGEAVAMKGVVSGKIIHVNHFGSVFVNVLADDFEKSGIRKGGIISVKTRGSSISAKFMSTFGDVTKGEVVAFPDDYGRVEIAINQGSFANEFGVRLLDEIKIKKA